MHPLSCPIYRKVIEKMKVYMTTEKKQFLRCKLCKNITAGRTNLCLYHLAKREFRTKILSRHGFYDIFSYDEYVKIESKRLTGRGQNGAIVK